MMPVLDLETTFGKVRPNALQWKPVIFIRHGICSNNVPFQPLKQYLQLKFPNSVVDNSSYDWRDSVLVNGARLANQVLNVAGDQPLVLIGHSMGGLLCRVANVIFQDPTLFDTNASNLANQLGYNGNDITEIRNFGFRHMKTMPKPNLIVTLATPNSGAMLHGQISGIPALLKLAARFFPPTNLQSVADLTTDRLFRFLEQFSVSTPVLSISGSKGNRFARASGTISNWLGNKGIKINMPNDLVVEDQSVDLHYSILPNEIVHHGRAKYLHARGYMDCTDVWHSNIYDDWNVRDLLVDCLQRC
jgi:pimeloyl-ACP methyl ester carboxylesterase